MPLEYLLQKSRYKDHLCIKESGLLEGLWDKDCSQLFNSEKASRRVEILGQIMKDEYGCDPTRGDAMVVMGKKKGWTPFAD